MPNYRQILEKLTRDELLTAVSTFNLEVADRRRRDLLVDALIGSQTTRVPEVLRALPRPRLMDLCRSLGLSDRGREKAVLLARLIDSAAHEPPQARTAAQLTLFPAHLASQSAVGSRATETFTVDTHLFRELGELLVGRDSTALVELIKNAYDADASEITVYGEVLGDPKLGFIQLVDRNGNGMTEEEFKNGFLRIASRLKELGERRSRRYRRRYTGAKGIGRLAAHKLARIIEIFTVSWIDDPGERRDALKATINWDEVERHETLDTLDKTEAVILETLNVPETVEAGTEITLRHLRGKWSSRERKRFIDEVQTFAPPSVLTRSVDEFISGKLLFGDAAVRGETDAADPGFHVHLEGDFEPGDDYWDVIAQAADWLIEIDASSDTGTVKYGIAPTKNLLRRSPDAEAATFDLRHRAPDEGPFFQARIFVRSPTRSKTGADWARRSTGIRVFVEGFRVPPYGEKGNDWLELDVHYAQRTRPLRRLLDLGFEILSEAGLRHLPNSSYFGAVFMTQEGAEGLRPLVNREGFVPDAPYHRLADMVRIGIDLATRHRAALHHRSPEGPTLRSEKPPGEKLDPKQALKKPSAAIV
jgi:hypothetical protein